MGAAEAALFVDEGASVVLADVDADGLEATAEKVAAGASAGAADRVHHLTLDVTSPDAWNDAVAAAVDRFGDLHVLVNNAGVTGRSLGTVIDDYPLDDWDFVVAVNLTGPFLGMRAAVPAMRASIERLREREPGATASIVNISSAQGFRPSFGNSAYAASKWGLRGLTKVAALDVAPLIRVNSVHPGPIDTPMVRPTIDADVAVMRQLIADVPLARLGSADDVANLVLFLASEESSFCTGAEFLVEGGRLAGPPRPE
jgi:3alpha(or 20beta)-hydroxysteroid dehydrogenase